MNILSGNRKFAAGAWITLLAAIAPCVALAVRIEVPPPPVSPFADTEVTTNISVAAANGHVRFLELAFALDGCASNCVQVAFGHDANGDGVLSFTETDTLYGWRNGRYFAEDVKAGVRTEEGEVTTDASPSATISRGAAVAGRLPYRRGRFQMSLSGRHLAEWRG